MLRIIFRVVLAVLFVALLVGAGVWIYNAGVTNGALTSGKLAVPNVNPAPGVVPYYGYYPFFHPFGFFFFPFGIIGLLIGIFIISMIFRAIFFWGSYGRGWGLHGRHGRMWGDPNQVPPMVEEWHKRMHGQPTDQEQPKTN